MGHEDGRMSRRMMGIKRKRGTSGRKNVETDDGNKEEAWDIRTEEC